MKREIIIALILGLSVGSVLPVEAQQRSSSSRRLQTRTATPNPTSGKIENESTVAPVESDVAKAPNVQDSLGASRPFGVLGVTEVQRMGSLILMELYAQARQESSDRDGSVRKADFLVAFMNAVKATDSDGDGKLTQEELKALAPNRANAPESRRLGLERPQGKASRAEDASVNESEANNVRVQESVLRGNIRRPNVNNISERRQTSPNGNLSLDDPNEQRRTQAGLGVDGLEGGAFGPGGFRQNPLFGAIIDSTDQENGSVDLVKLEKALKTALDEADVDNDGILDRQEWRSFAGMAVVNPNGFAGSRPNSNAFRAMQILSIQRDAQSGALTEDGKLNIEKFRAEYLKLLKEADSNKDGVLKEDELQAMQQKVMEKRQEEMRERMQGGMGRSGGRGFGQGTFFEQFKNIKGEVELSKLEGSSWSEQLKQELNSFDSDGNGALSEEELNRFQEQMRNRFQNDDYRGGSNPAGRGGTLDNNASNFSGGENTVNRTQVLSVSDGDLDEDRRAGGGRDEGGSNRGGMGVLATPRMGFLGGGFGRGGMGGFATPFFGGVGNNVVQSAATKSMNEEDEFKIANFDQELGKLLSDADNEDDGVLEPLEQIDAFGRELMREDGRGAQSERNNPSFRNDRFQRERGNRDSLTDRVNQGGRGFGERGVAEPEEIMRARFLPTPDFALFVPVPANENFKFSKPFKKGSVAEKSPIKADYAIGRYEVRNREYKEFVDATKRAELPKTWIDGSYHSGTKNCPVVGVSVKDAEDYCEWLATKYNGWSFRLPTEAEFENAASGPQKLLYPWGKTASFSYTKGELTAECQYNAKVVADLIAEDASATIGDKSLKVKDFITITSKGVLSKGWRDSKTKTGFTYSQEFSTKSKIGGYTVPVYKFLDNRSPYGCVGTSGNVAEWTSTVVDGKNVVRGGSWYSSLEECSATFRGETQDASRGTPTVGFRVVAERL